MTKQTMQKPTKTMSKKKLTRNQIIKKRALKGFAHFGIKTVLIGNKKIKTS